MKSIIKIFGSSLILLALLCLSQSATAQSKIYTDADLDVLVQQQAENIGLIAEADFDEANHGITYQEYLRNMRSVVTLPRETTPAADAMEQKSATKSSASSDGQ